MKHILVVEDDSFLNKILSSNLTTDNYEITSVPNARSVMDCNEIVRSGCYTKITKQIWRF